MLDIGQTVKVKVLDIDRDRQRISLGLKQTQTDPWQQVLDSYREDDVVEGRVAKVVTFGAFVEILPGVEGLVHISELAAHHVENPREVVSQGQAVNVRILEIDGERRRLSLSLKRVEEGEQPVPRADGAESVHTMPDLRLSEEAFPTARPRPSSTSTRPSRSDAEDEDVAEPSVEAEAAEAEAEPEEVAEVELEEPRPTPRRDRRRGRARGRRAEAEEPIAEAEPSAEVESVDEPTPRRPRAVRTSPRGDEAEQTDPS